MLLTLMISTITLVLVRSHRYLCKNWQKGDYMETVMMMRLCLGVVVCLAQPLGKQFHPQQRSERARHGGTASSRRGSISRTTHCRPQHKLIVGRPSCIRKCSASQEADARRPIRASAGAINARLHAFVVSVTSRFDIVLCTNSTFGGCVAKWRHYGSLHHHCPGSCRGERGEGLS